jgi:anti-sigma regulatory factor (Ser/Thr protein kinase)
MPPRGVFPGTGAAAQGRGGPRGAAAAPQRWLQGTEPGHVAFFYDSQRDYTGVTSDFVRSGLAAGDPVLVAVPAANAEIIRATIGRGADGDGTAQRPVFADMNVLGRNPARILAALCGFADSHPGQLLHYVGEPAWPSRTPPEQAEVVRHEQLLDVAFGDARVRMLCPYDATGLEPDVLVQAAGTHRVLMRNGRLDHSAAFSPAARAHAAAPLSSPPPGVPCLTYRDDPRAAREFARRHAQAAGLAEPALTDLVIAVGELAANTLRHTAAAGTIQVWAEADEVICQISDRGFIRDVLAGRRCPPADAAGGHGLWVVHQVCDLVEMRTGSSGTVFRLHMARPG